MSEAMTDEALPLASGDPSRLLFGSCSSQHYRHQPIWQTMLQRNATAFVWAGDAIYADDRRDEVTGIILDATPEHFRRLYREQREHPQYKAFVESMPSIFGTIDDHDFGRNNGDRTFPYKRESGMAYVEQFLGLSPDDPMTQRAKQGKGVYGVQVYDFSQSNRHQRLVQDTNAVSFGDRHVAVFVLDVRTNKSPWPPAKPWWGTSDNDKESEEEEIGDFLGEEQWEWLEESLRNSQAAVNIIVSGLVVHPRRFIAGRLVEEWSQFPQARNRLYQTLLNASPNNTPILLVSGDVHYGQFVQNDCYRRRPDGGIERRSLPEMTTSGLTHAWGSSEGVTARPHFLPSWMKPGSLIFWYFNSIPKWVLKFAHFVHPWRDILQDPVTNKLQVSLEINFGEVEIDWDHGVLTAEIFGLPKNDRDSSPSHLLEHTWSMDGLRTSVIDSVEDSPRLGQSLGQEWLCVDHSRQEGFLQEWEPVHRSIALALTAGLATFLVTAPVLWLPLVCILLMIRRCRGQGSKQASKRKWE